MDRKIGLAWGDATWTWADLDRRVDAMAAALAARGVRKGDRILVQSKNGNQMFESMFACFRLGAVWVPTNFRQTPGEVAYLGQASGASAMICHWRVVVADLEPRNLDQARQTLGDHETRLRFEPLDVTDEDGVGRAIARCEAEFGPLTGLVNSAGVGSDRPVSTPASASSGRWSR